LGIVFGYEGEEEGEEEKHTENPEGAEGFVVGDGAAHDGFQGAMGEVDGGEVVEHSGEETEDAEAEGDGHGDQEVAGRLGHWVEWI
jgi:hypothetical protein